MANLSTIKEENNKPTAEEQKKMRALLQKKGVKVAKLKETMGTPINKMRPEVKAAYDAIKGGKEYTHGLGLKIRLP